MDLQDHPLEEADRTLYTDGSSYMDKGNRKAGYAVVILDGRVVAKALLLGTSAQKAELVALMRALELSHEKNECAYRLRVCFPNFACAWFHLEGKTTVNH